MSLSPSPPDFVCTTGLHGSLIPIHASPAISDVAVEAIFPQTDYLKPATDRLDKPDDHSEGSGPWGEGAGGGGGIGEGLAVKLSGRHLAFAKDRVDRKP